MQGKASKSDDDDDEIKLPDDTLKILHEFLVEKRERENTEKESIQLKKGKDVNFDEDWQLSQFWYSSKTKADLAKVCEKISTQASKIALLSCPSLYPSIKKIYENVLIFEYDKRFSSFGSDFVFYDFNEGASSDYLLEYKDYFDIIIADPPFLSEECVHKISHIIQRFMHAATKVIFCSGAVVEPWVEKYLSFKKCDYKPQHERNLGNEFVSYANFNLDEYV